MLDYLLSAIEPHVKSLTSYVRWPEHELIIMFSSFHTNSFVALLFPKAVGFNHSYYQPLCLAILKGDWKSTRDFLDIDPSALTAKVAVLGRTALHVAAVGAQWEFVIKLVQEMPEDMLTELDLMGRSCLHYVAMGRSINAAKALVTKNPCVTQVTDFKGFTPLIYSITSKRCKEMVWYLVSNTTDERPSCPFSGPSASQLVALLTAAGYHGFKLRSASAIAAAVLLMR
ncbi:ankyrin repeat family protein [Trifolium medium]|uniref:Ankyrin repeat family protein n=1 Tax=Trifolium medium TaxID=97028 RepID=A0A392MEJ4_9FABA|nr:ankyrin repeat family protein [Trifolium medium]